MRTIGRLLGSLFVVALVVGIFSMTVLADRAVIDSGSAEYGRYSYTLYSDGELYISFSGENNGVVYLQDIEKSSTLEQVKTITVNGDNPDFTPEYSGDSFGVSLIGYNYLCKPEKINIIGSPEYVSIDNISSVNGEDITIPQDTRYVSFVRMDGIESFEFLNDYQNIKEVSFYDCDSVSSELVLTNRSIERLYISENGTLNKIDASLSGLQSIELRICSVSEVYLPDNCKVVHLSNCSFLTDLYIPLNVEYFDYWCFDECSSLTDLYYAGSKTRFGDIKVVEWSYAEGKYIDAGIELYEWLDGMTVHYYCNTKSEWVQDDDGTWYYLDENSDFVTGWNKIDGVWYYFDEDGIMLKNWQKINEKWYYLGSNGTMRTGWQKIDSNWYYLGTDGAMSTKWRSVDGKWYYFGDSGVMRTGWWQLDGSWYYLKASGEMATGWVSSGGYWYYMNNNGVMLKNWQQIDGTWYYLGNSGAMLTGWQKVSGKYYYFASSGAMQTGWLKLGNTWYYLEGSGEMVTGKKTIDGIEYTFDDETGVWVA